MEKKGISDKDKKLLCILLAIGCFALAYFLGFNHFNKKTSEVETEISTLSARLNDLREKQANRQMYINETEAMKEKMKIFVEEFPEYITTEKSIIFGTELEEKCSVSIQSMAFAETTNFYTPMTEVETPVLDADGNPTGEKTKTQGVDEDGVSGYVTQVTAEMITGYESLKNVVNYTNDSVDRITIDSIEMSYNQEDAKLSGTVVFNMYAASNSGNEYKPPVLDDVKTGTLNIFGTIEEGKSTKKNKNANN